MCCVVIKVMSICVNQTIYQLLENSLSGSLIGNSRFELTLVGLSLAVYTTKSRYASNFNEHNNGLYI